MNLRIFWSSVDKINFILILILGLLGVLLSYSVNQNFLIINKHSVFYICSLLIIIFLSQQSDKNIRRFSLFGFIILIILLLLLFFFDYEVKGAKRWLKVNNFSFQPSEVIKPFFIILSSWGIAKSIQGRKYYLVTTFIFFIILISLVLMQPDLGMTILISATFFCQLFLHAINFTCLNFYNYI